MKYLKKDFDNNCEELTILRWFRDNFVSKEEIEHYYKIAPIIVEIIEELKDKDIIYKMIYEDVILPCLISIKKENYTTAHTRYKNNVLELEKQYVHPNLEKRFIKILKYKIKNEK